MDSRVSIAGVVAQQDHVRHQTAIDQLTRDNQKLVQELALESKHDHLVNNSSASVEIKRLQDQGDAYTRKIELERRRISELEKQISLVQEKVNMQRRKMGGVNVSRQNNQVLSKQIRVLENRLEKSIVRYNEILGKNKLLKEKIDDLRKERLIFDGIYKKLEREMHSEKKEMQNLVEECNKAYKERDQAKLEIDKLKRQADDEQQRFQVEWKKLGELIEKDKKAKDMNQLLPDTSSIKLGELSTEEEKALKHKIAKGAWTIGKEKIQIQISQEKAQSYEEMFAKIQEETGVSDIEELVQRFVEAEDKNFSLFNHVSELNSEIEKIEQQIGSVTYEIDKYRGQGANSENQRKRILFDLEQKLEQTNTRADLYEEKHQNSQEVLSQLKVGIQSMFEKIGSENNETILDMLGGDGVTEQNIMQYLGVIEQRANEILQIFSVSNPGNVEALQTVLGGGNGVEDIQPAEDGGVALVNLGPNDPLQEGGVRYPTLSDIEKHEHMNDAAFEDDIDRPLTMQELQSNMVKQMSEVQKPPQQQVDEVEEQEKEE